MAARNFLIALALATIPFSAQALPFEISGKPVGCATENSNYRLVDFQGKVVLNKNFLLPEGPERDRMITDAIELQTKNLMGFFKNSRLDGINNAVSAYRGQAKIVEMKEIKYLAQVEIENYLPVDRPTPNSVYVQKALTEGKTTTDDPALEVSFSQELIIADCSEHGWKAMSQVILPLDPYLSYWIEDKKDRLPLRFGEAKLNEASNCLALDIARFGSTDQSWYFWSPIETKIDTDGKSHKCHPSNPSLIYTPKMTLIKNLDSPPRLTRDFFGKDGAFKMTFVFGIIEKEEGSPKIDISAEKKILSSVFLKCRESKLTPHCLTEWSKLINSGVEKQRIELGFYHLLLFLKFAHNILDFENVKLVKTDDAISEMLISFKAKFKDSKKPVSGTIYYGNTTLDYGPPVSSTYAKVMHDGIKDASIVTYLGHAGLGHNFSMDEFSKIWKRSNLREIHRTKPLWVGVYNCEGFSYFGLDLKNMFKDQKMKLFFSASSGVEVGAQYVLSQLNILDQALTVGSQDIPTPMGKFVQTRDFLTATYVDTTKDKN